MKKGMEFSNLENKSEEEELKEYKVISRFHRHFEPGKDPVTGASLDFLSEKGKEQAFGMGKQSKETDEAGKIKKGARSFKERAKQSIEGMLEGAGLSPKDIKIYQKEELNLMNVPNNIREDIFFDKENNRKKTLNESTEFALNHPDLQSEVMGAAERIAHRVNVALKIPRILAKGDKKLEEFSKRLGNDVLLENITHGPVQEAFLKKVVILDDSKGGKKRGFDSVEEIGGAFKPGEGFEIETVVDKNGEQTKKLIVYRLNEEGTKIVKRDELEVDWDEIKRLGENYRERKVAEVRGK